MGRVIALRQPAIDSDADDALLARGARGDGAALGELFDRHHRSVYNFLGRLLGAQCAELDDAVQSTFLEACRAASKFRGQSAASTWLFGIAANVARHQVRSRLRRQTLVEALGQAPTGATTQPDVEVERHQLVDRMTAAIAALPHDLRVAFVLCDVEEIRGAEAARVLGIPEGTLWRRLYEARKALQRQVHVIDGRRA
jgi:RNA polymerase sigma-70 factor (ECF subfamily)